MGRNGNFSRNAPPTLLGDPQARSGNTNPGAIVVERNRWFLATIIAGLIAAAAVAAVAMLLPLRNVSRRDGRFAHTAW